MSQPTHEQVNLMLRLYEMRREPRLRQARAWFVNQFTPTGSPEEFMQKYPPGSEENASIRMAVSYWDMCAAIANRGMVDEDMFFETTGEQWVVWEKIKQTAPTWRSLMKNPMIFANLEEHCRRFEAWREKRAPGSNEAMRKMFEQRAEAQKASG